MCPYLRHAWISRIGANRELKKALESFWAEPEHGSRSSTERCSITASTLVDDEGCRYGSYSGRGFFSVRSYVGHGRHCRRGPSAVPAHDGFLDALFRDGPRLSKYQEGIDVAALEMTKWFDTNYHYIVPELEVTQSFTLNASRLLGEIEEAISLGIEPRPVILGPVTFLALSKYGPGAPTHSTTLSRLKDLLPVYEALLSLLAARHIAWVQLDEPCLTMELEADTKAAYRQALSYLVNCPKRPRLLLATYFGALADNLPIAVESGCDGLHVDLVCAPEQLHSVLEALPGSMCLSAGIVDGRNIWRTDLDAAHATIRRAVATVGTARVLVGSSCSFLHVPIDLTAEHTMDDELKSWLAFATQKLDEIRTLADAAQSSRPAQAPFLGARAARSARRTYSRTRNAAVRSRVQAVTDAMFCRSAACHLQNAPLSSKPVQSPGVSTTTMGHFRSPARCVVLRPHGGQGD